MSPWGPLFRNVLLPAWEGARGRPTLDRWAYLEQTQWLPARAIAAAQLGDLRRLLAHATAHVPYWRDVLARAEVDPFRVRGLEDLRRIPPLDKRTIRERRADLVDARTRRSHISKRSSGTSGQQTEIEYDVGSEAWRQAARMRGWGWAGYRAGDPVVYYWGQPVALRGVTGAKIRLDRALRRELYVECLVHDPPALDAALDAIERFRPRVLVGYAIALALLARHARARRAARLGPVPVITCAEPLSARDRADLEAAFGGPVFETYGARETMLLAAECDVHDGLHTMDDVHVVEVVVGDRPAEPGEVGEVLVTDLHNYGMPLIRYRNGDLAVAGPREPCACGRGFARIQSVAGRVSDTLRGPRGEAIPGMALHAVLATHAPRVREAQLVQRGDRSVVLRIVRDDGFRAETQGKVRAALERYLRGLPLTIECVERIERGPGGKYRPVVVEA